VKWKLIKKAAPPVGGTYKDWKGQLADEGGHQCVYCTIHEAGFGGYRNFHVEHFRPRRHFPLLTDQYGNLFYACAICNSLKGDDWPCGSRLGPHIACYPDPSRTSYADVLGVRWTTGRALGRTRAGRFVLERLYLNRPQLVMERRAFSLQRALLREAAAVRGLIERPIGPTRKNGKKLTEVIRLFETGMRLMAKYNRVRPYLAADVNR
jgi:hypothetical protein